MKDVRKVKIDNEKFRAALCKEVGFDPEECSEVYVSAKLDFSFARVEKPTEDGTEKRYVDTKSTIKDIVQEIEPPQWDEKYHTFYKTEDCIGLDELHNPIYEIDYYVQYKERTELGKKIVKFWLFLMSFFNGGGSE